MPFFFSNVTYLECFGYWNENLVFSSAASLLPGICHLHFISCPSKGVWNLSDHPKMFTSSLFLLFYSRPSFAFLFPCSYTSPNKGVSWFPASPYPSNYLTLTEKKKSASRNQTLLKEKMLLPICSGRLTIKIPDKGIKAYVSEHEHV